MTFRKYNSFTSFSMAAVFLLTIVASCFTVLPLTFSENTVYQQQDSGDLSLSNFFVDDDEVDDEDDSDSDGAFHLKHVSVFLSSLSEHELFLTSADLGLLKSDFSHHLPQSRRIFLLCRKLII